MDLTPGQQRLLFVVVVLALGGLGGYLISGGHHGAAATPAASPTVTSSATGKVPAAASAGLPPATVPPAPPPATTPGGTNIYEYLPFTQADLTAAAKNTLAFAGDYVNWSYTESKAAYGAKLAPVTTPQEVATLQYDQYGTAGVAGQMITDRQVSTGTATIESISSFGRGQPSITFAVGIVKQLASTKGTTSNTSTYSITTVLTSTGWQVSDIELATAGNP